MSAQKFEMFARVAYKGRGYTVIGVPAHSMMKVNDEWKPCYDYVSNDTPDSSRSSVVHQVYHRTQEDFEAKFKYQENP